MPYTAYIEEAGDEGLGKGSRWFIVGAVLVDKSKDLTVSRCIDEIKQKFKIYRGKGNLYRYGLEFLPDNIHHSEELLQTYPWLKKI